MARYSTVCPPGTVAVGRLALSVSRVVANSPYIELSASRTTPWSLASGWVDTRVTVSTNICQATCRASLFTAKVSSLSCGTVTFTSVRRAVRWYHWTASTAAAPATPPVIANRLRFVTCVRLKTASPVSAPMTAAPSSRNVVPLRTLHLGFGPPPGCVALIRSPGPSSHGVTVRCTARRRDRAVRRYSQQLDHGLEMAASWMSRHEQCLNPTRTRLPGASSRAPARLMASRARAGCGRARRAGPTRTPLRWAQLCSARSSTARGLCAQEREQPGESSLDVRAS